MKTPKIRLFVMLNSNNGRFLFIFLFFDIIISFYGIISVLGIFRSLIFSEIGN